MPFVFFRFRRSTAALLILSQLLFGIVRCNSAQRMESVPEQYPPLPSPRDDLTPIRIVILPFKNSAEIGEFDIIPDGDYGRNIFDPGHRAKSRTEPNETEPNETEPVKEEMKDRPTELEPPRVRSGLVAREVTETALLQTGRFEIVPYFEYRNRLAEHERLDPGNPYNPLSAARDLQVRYLMNGDLTNFEIRQKRSYWKIPLWVLLLIAALFINNDDLRSFAVHTLVRVMFFTPLNSILWTAGIGWDDLDLEVDISLNLRAVDTHSGSVVFAAMRDVTRTENVRNIHLLLWASNRRLKITRSNAGKQIRYAAHYLVADWIRELEENRGQTFLQQ